MKRPWRKPIPSKELILSFLEYNSKNGQFLWKKHRSKKKIGSLAGSADSEGYIRIRVAGVSYCAHRLVWRIERNEESDFLDHIDGNKANNKISNLRVVTCRLNQANRPIHRNGRLLGARPRGDGKWRAQIELPKGKTRKAVSLGEFETEKEAHAAYKGASKMLSILETLV